jgi:predicted S18 family serine protease
MIDLKNGKWTTEDGERYDYYTEAVQHKRALIRERATAAGCKTEAEVQAYRKRYWHIRESEKREKEKVKSK